MKMFLIGLKHTPVLDSTLYHTIPGFFSTQRKKPSENTVGKGENAGNLHIVLFPQCFLLF